VNYFFENTDNKMIVTRNAHLVVGCMADGTGRQRNHPKLLWYQ